MPTDRDYAIATMLGENRGDTNQGLAAILDLIMNRKADPSAYQAKSSSIKDIVTGGNGNQFNNWKPGEANRGVSDRALQGIGSMSASEAPYYAQAAQVYDDYMAGKNGYQGIAQGATFYQTPKSAENERSYQNRYYGENGDNLINIGRHQFTGQPNLFYKDQGAFYEKFPQYNPMATAGYDPSSPLNPGGDKVGPGDFLNIGDGQIGNSGRPVETGNPYGFGTIDAAGDVGPGFNNLGTATPTGPAPGTFDFAGSLAAGGDATNGSFGTGITPGSPAPAPGQYDFAGGLAAGGNVPNADFGAGITQPSAQVAGTIAPTQAPTLAPQQASAVPYNGFDAKAYLAANPDVVNSATYGNNPLQHYLDYGYAEGRTLDPQGHQIAKGIDLNRYLADNPDVAAARIDPLAHYLVNGAAEGRTLAPGSTGLTIGAPSTTGSLPPSFSSTIGPTPGQSVTASQGIGPFDFSSSYLAANPDVAAAGMNPWEHFVRYGAKEGRALDTAGDKFDANQYLSQNQDVLQAGLDPLLHYVQYGASEGRAAPIVGADGTARTIGSLGVTPTLTASLMPYLQPQGAAQTLGAPGLSPLVGADTASTIGAPGLSPTISPPSAPTLGPDFASLIGAGPSVQATSPGIVSPFGFGSNVSQGVPNGSFGTGITPQAPISNWGFSAADYANGVGAQPQSLGGSYGVGSAISNMGMDLPGVRGVNDYGFGGDVSGYDVNQGGGAPAAQEAPVASGYGDGGSVQGRNSQLSQNEYFATQARQQALATANNQLFGQQITSVAPGNQAVYDYATGKATGGQAPQMAPFVQTPVNMSGVFAPLATAAFMPRFTF